jgi:DNA-binding HxlR family transcriptional regulator
MDETDFTCGMDVALTVMGGKWKPLILFHLAQRPQRFGELRRLVTGISEKMLIQQLRELESDGIVARRDFRELPPKVEYSLTDFGQGLATALAPLCAWGRGRARSGWLRSIRGPTASLTKKRCRSLSWIVRSRG